MGKRAVKELLLAAGAGDGSFAIVLSDRGSHFRLSVCHAGGVHHYRVDERASRGGGCSYGIEDGVRSRSMEALVAHYSATADGLVCALRARVPALPACGPVSTAPAPIPAGLLIEVDAVALGEELGAGEFATVRAGTLRRPDGARALDVAVKVLKKRGGPHEVAAFTREATIMAALCHRHIVQLFGVCQTPSELWMVTELAPLGSLRTVLRTRGCVDEALWGAGLRCRPMERALVALCQREAPCAVA